MLKTQIARILTIALGATVAWTPSAKAGKFIYIRLNPEAEEHEIVAIRAEQDRANRGPPPRIPPSELITISGPFNRGRTPLSELRQVLNQLQRRSPPENLEGLVISGHSDGDEYFLGESGTAFRRDELIRVFQNRPTNMIPDAVYLLGCYSLTPRQVLEWRRLQGVAFVFGFTNQSPTAESDGNIRLLRHVILQHLGLENVRDARAIRTLLEVVARHQYFAPLTAAVCSSQEFFNMNYISNPIQDPDEVCRRPSVITNTTTALENYRRYCAGENISPTNMRRFYNHYQYGYHCLSDEQRNGTTQIPRAPRAIEFLHAVKGHHDCRSSR